MEKLRVTQNSQSLGLNLVTCNLSSLLPSLHPKPPANENTATVTMTTVQPITNKKADLLDRSVFDDDSESNNAGSNQATIAMTTNDVSSDDKKKGTLDQNKENGNENGKLSEVSFRISSLYFKRHANENIFT